MPEVKHTMFAQQALSLAELFQAVLGGKPVGTGVKYRAELAAPDGPSTGGGKQSLQAIKLTPIDTGTTLVVGHANQVEGTAEVRTYEYLVRMQQQRFKGSGEFPLDRAAYDAFLAQLQTFLTNNRMRVAVLAAPPGPAPTAAPAEAPRSGQAALYIGLAVVAAALAGLAAYLLRR